MEPGRSRSERPLVIVLMATHQGQRYVEEQLRSILAQDGVEVRVVVSDDASDDGTPDRIRALGDDRVTILPPGRFGTPQANFLRLLREADVRGADAIALADQDDRWYPDKLARQVELLRAEGADAVSSNVLAVWESSERAPELIDKAQPQVELDYLLESAGPGCTFVLGSEAFSRVRASLVHVDDDGAVPHDWLIYAIVRATGGTWAIDAAPTMEYRQHGANATGANRGLAQAAVRLRQLASGVYRERCARVARVAAAVAPAARRARLEHVAALLASRALRSRIALSRLAPVLRREPSEQRLLRIVLLLGIW